MPHAPWFKFYAADYMSSPFVQALEPEQELWYVRLIIASAISDPRGCLPLANSKLWRLAKAPSLEHFERYAAPLLAKFEKDDVIQLYRVPKVIEQNLVAKTDLSNKRSKAGKQGAAKRWQIATNRDGKLPLKKIATENTEIADSDSDSGKSKASARPTLEEVAEYCGERRNNVDPQHFYDHYTANGWKVGPNAMRDWKAAVRTWERNGGNHGNGNINRAEQRTANNLAALNAAFPLDR